MRDAVMMLLRVTGYSFGLFLCYYGGTAIGRRMIRNRDERRRIRLSGRD